MKKLALQFFSTRGEIADFLDRVVSDLNGQVFLMQTLPFSVRPVQGATSAWFRENLSRVRLLLSRNELSVKHSSPGEFYDANSGVVTVDVGRVFDDCIEESALMCIAHTHEEIEFAQAVARTLQRMSKTGLVAANPFTGATQKLRSHRITPGAEKLCGEGCRLVPLAGTSEIFVEQVRKGDVAN